MNQLLAYFKNIYTALSEKGNDESKNEHNRALYLCKNGFERLCATWLAGWEELEIVTATLNMD